MARFMDERSRASNPAGISLSTEKLSHLEPALLGTERFLCSSPVCSMKHTTADLRARLQEHLELGDSRAAVVVATQPLLVAAWSDDLDGAVLLRFPEAFVERYALTPGSRLLSVNTYQALRHPKTREPVVAVDLVPGPEATGWSNVHPCIAEFISDDSTVIDARKRAIDEAEWAKLDVGARKRIEALGVDTARPGGPLHLGTPVPLAASPDLFRAASGAGFSTMSPSRMPLLVGAIVVVAVLTKLLALLGK